MASKRETEAFHERYPMRYEPLLHIHFNRPADEFNLFRLENKLHWAMPLDLSALLQITNGMELNRTQTVFYSVKEICNCKVDLPKGLTVIGAYSFGDYICMRWDGGIVQVSVDDNLPYLSWASLEDFLQDEFENCKGG